MVDNYFNTICETRILVGFLGEKGQSAWWDSSFLSPASKTFLAPIFPNTIPVAQYTGVCQAASIVHDEHIGIGRHYHLYRLPDSIERQLLKCIQDQEFAENLAQHLSSQDAAINRLKELGEKTVKKTEGPIVAGDYSDTKLNDLVGIARAHYITAMQKGYKAFPYMRCA